MLTAEHEYGTYAFGLTAEQEQRARTLHRDSIVVDMLFQGPCSPDVWTDDLVKEFEATSPPVRDKADQMAAWTFLAKKAMRGEFPEYRELFEACGVTTALTGCMLSDKTALLDSVANYSRMLGAFPWLRPARRADDIRAANAAGHHAVWGVCQFNLLQPGSLDLIDAAHSLGVLHTADCAYNTMTFVGAGCTERYDVGLSHFGLAFVQRCNDVGVIVDTAHSGRQTTLDACAASTNPVIATHTSAAGVYTCDRAKSDEELRAIADTGGVVGVVAVPFFLAPPDMANPTIDVMLDHIDYIANLVGWEHVGIGTDWPLGFPASIQEQVLLPLLTEIGFRPEHNIDVTATLEGFRDYRDLVNITRGLVARGYTDEQVRGILGENFVRVFEAVNG